ncbi:AEC family transporter [Chitinispirillales bacterium ANBcel5]|uniref:AEC family transporter n=1 Tax=Cellulosispirillum alkaliphilum TaxID=3039283 RepID=UPI002A4E9C84|nr:AEC family transporter [Chitinispirillales bacterium ANBcel5]
MILPVMSAVVEIFGLFAIGWIAHHWGYIDQKETVRWSRFSIDFLLPAYIFSSITQGFEPDRLHELWPLPFIGIGLVIMGASTGLLLRYGLFTRNRDLKKTYLHFCAVNNSGYLPIIIIRNLWGESALANLFFFNLGTTLGMWTIGVGVLGEIRILHSLRTVLTPNLVAVLLGLFFSLSGLQAFVPSTVRNILMTAGSAAVPMMLILIGASFHRPGLIRVSWPVFYASASRLLLLPLIAVIILNLLPISREVYKIAVVVALMPVAVSSTILTIRYGGDPDYAAQTSITTSVAAIITVPLALHFLL